MFYVPDGTERCGFYECSECGSRFLDIRIAPTIVCPYCGEEPDMEIGPDEYARRREALLAGVPHAALPETFFRFQEKLCRLGGGALLRLRGERGAEGLACVSPEAGEARVPELLWTGDAEEAAAALAARFGAARCVARAPGEGLKTVMGAEKTLREPFWWGPVFD